MDTKPRSVGVFFKPVVIDPRLRDLVNTILLAPSATAPQTLSAQRRIRAMTKPVTSYLFATEIQGYLDSKTLGGTETRVYPLVGDLFMDALEVNLTTLGPNFFRDHYSGIVWCYGHGRCPGKAIQGGFYAIDLVLRKSVELYLAKETGGKAPKGVRLSFQSDEDLDYTSMLTAFLDLAKQALRDVVEVSTRAEQTKFPPTFMEFVIDRKQKMDKVLAQWERFHRRKDLQTAPNDQYLDGVAEIADDTAHAPLAAMVKEYQVREREQRGLLVDGRSELEQGVHPLFNAATIYLELGAQERDHEAYDLALRRFGRAAAMYSKIHDRTSTAKAYVERARAYIKSGDDPESLRESLHTAFALITAHMKDLPKDVLPKVTDVAAIEFLRTKGYIAEADAYQEALTVKTKDQF